MEMYYQTNVRSTAPTLEDLRSAMRVELAASQRLGDERLTTRATSPIALRCPVHDV
ncbi:hypothetical protein BAUCODRAFT_238720 [Baudoinia panamericana UAMH 10762]|uniref:Uncharacterized protein n=1 Tax=Baudoinia panamericana (strain UAMH 10762) TaxID=717646 RepID=M2N322_BAUPA|nr:uncharacterized protein BAUCODRAFT_238720 [Baudoinia panamericana UAMH 10762]EMC93379.1 hypothetical protein BAUCODRAFT_238720 [Baudoinia panamericana UAMH 10762]